MINKKPKKRESITVKEREGLERQLDQVAKGFNLIRYYIQKLKSKIIILEDINNSEKLEEKIEKLKELKKSKESTNITSGIYFLYNEKSILYIGLAGKGKQTLIKRLIQEFSVSTQENSTQGGHDDGARRDNGASFYKALIKQKEHDEAKNIMKTTNISVLPVEKDLLKDIEKICIYLLQPQYNINNKKCLKIDLSKMIKLPRECS